MNKYILASSVKMRSNYTVESFSHFHLRDGMRCSNPAFCGEQHLRQLNWRETFHNVVTTAGLNTLLGGTFDAAAGSVAWYVGLIGAATGTIAETAAANAMTGTSTSFQAAQVGSDIIVVGAGASGADLNTTVATRTSTTAATTTANATTTVTAALFAIEPVAADVMSSKLFNENVVYSNANRPTWTKNGSPSAGAMSNSSSKAAFTINGSSRIFGAFLTSDNTKSGTTGTLYGGGLFSISRAVENGDTLNVQVDLSATST